MLVKDIMTTNVVTTPSDTPIMEARKIMQFHQFERLPIVDKGKLLGVLTGNTVMKASPSEATSLSVWELNYVLAKMKVKEIMKTNVVTVAPDMTVECAIATAQDSKVGSLVVLDDGKVVGILTTNDLFYKILNPLMGIVSYKDDALGDGAGEAKQMQKVIESINKSDVRIKTVCTLKSLEGEDKNDLAVHLDTEDASQIIAQLKDLGFSVDIRIDSQMSG